MNEGLDKQLAEWAGVKWYEPLKGVLTPEPIPDLLESDELNFTESLDACFKWIKPQVIAGYGYQVWLDLLHEWIDVMPLIKREGKEALTLCLGIEKLIDSKEDDA